jgi:hypothetical protein
MQIGTTSCIGFTVIQGPSIANNALSMLQHGGVLPEGASVANAGRFARAQARRLRRLENAQSAAPKDFSGRP